MSHDRHLAALGRWKACGPAEVMSLVRRHPDLGLATRTLAANSLALAQQDRALASVFKDAGRYVVAMWAFYLDAGEGLTLPRLKAVCAQSGLLSPGRARALLQFLEHLGYVTPQSRGPSGAATAYDLTPAFRSAWQAQLRAALEGARRLEPAVGLLLDRLHEPAILKAFERVHAGGLLASAAQRPIPLTPPFVRVFMHPHAGLLVLFVLLTCSEDEAFPPRRAGPVSLAALARRFAVSRIHLKRLFDEAERQGLARLGPDGYVVFEPGVGEALRFFYANQMAQMISAAAAVLDEADGIVRAA
ncbi:hypothetical protein [Phenylobacterium sp.]|uniref:hypothetical protein n=1 Tax=Phenylobacterium sp. TaxID=1871053 RepID=UPI003561B6F8